MKKKRIFPYRVHHNEVLPQPEPLRDLAGQDGGGGGGQDDLGLLAPAGQEGVYLGPHGPLHLQALGDALLDVGGTLCVAGGGGERERRRRKYEFRGSLLRKKKKRKKLS